MDIVERLRGAKTTLGQSLCFGLVGEAADEIARLRDENAKLRAELNAVASALPGPIYMDPPDGGSVTVAEQIARMAKDAERYRWLRTEASAADWEMFGYQDIDMTDAAIDAAMQKGE